jgi:hypothetical protein
MLAFATLIAGEDLRTAEPALVSTPLATPLDDGLLTASLVRCSTWMQLGVALSALPLRQTPRDPGAEGSRVLPGILLCEVAHAMLVNTLGCLRRHNRADDSNHPGRSPRTVHWSRRSVEAGMWPQLMDGKARLLRPPTHCIHRRRL